MVEEGGRGELMEHWLERMGWTKRYFAERHEVSEKTVQRWCSGEAFPPRCVMRDLEMCVRVLGV